MTARKIVLWYVTVTVIGGIFAVPKSGPYDIIINELKPCAEVGTGQFRFDSKMQYAGGGKHTYSSNLTIGLPIDEHFMAKVDIQQWSSQGYRPRAIVQTAKGCKQVWPLVKTFLVSVFTAAGVNITGCPIPQGNYIIRDWEVALKFDSLPVLPYNKYKGVVDLYYKGVKTGCINIFGETIPKRKSVT